jgi:hypothetical protein
MTPQTASGRLILSVEERVLLTACFVGLDCDNLMSGPTHPRLVTPHMANSRPPATSTQQSNKQLSCPLSSLTLANLKPSSLGKRIQRLEKKIKKGRGPKPHSRDDEVTSSSSSMNSSNNANNVGSDGVLITATSAPVSSRPSSGSPFVLNPMLAGPPPVLDPMFGPVQQERESILRAAFAVCTL